MVTGRKSIPSSDTFTTFSIHAISKLRLPLAARKSLGETENNPLAERNGKTAIPARAWIWPPTLFLQGQQKRQYRQHSSARSRWMAEKNSKQSVRHVLAPFFALQGTRTSCTIIYCASYLSILALYNLQCNTSIRQPYKCHFFMQCIHQNKVACNTYRQDQIQ